MSSSSSSSPLFESKWLAEYRKLGGLKSDKEYIVLLNLFYCYTMDAFVMGDIPEWLRKKGCENRDDCFELFVKKCLKNDFEEGLLIFHSVDNITTYS